MRNIKINKDKSWYEKKWYFAKYVKGCGGSIGISYRVVDRYTYQLGLSPDTGGFVWGIRIF